MDERGSGSSMGQVANFDVRANYAGANRSSDLGAIEAELASPSPARPAEELGKIREIITEEQFLPESVTCSADLIHADGRRQELRNIVVSNTITTDWRGYTLVNR